MAKKKKSLPPIPEKIEVDWKLVDKLLGIFCIGEEVASVLGISYDTLERRCKEDKEIAFADYSASKRRIGKSSLRRKQWLMADHNPAMAIFLGKNYLGQADKIHQEITGKDGKPLVPRETIIKVEYCKPTEKTDIPDKPDVPIPKGPICKPKK